MAENLLACRVGVPLASLHRRSWRIPRAHQSRSSVAAGPFSPLPCRSLSSCPRDLRLARLYSSSSSAASTIVNDNVDLATEGIDTGIDPEIENHGGGGDSSGTSGGGGGDGDKGGDGGSEEDSSGTKEKTESDKRTGLSMSQKLTLGYAALVGIGGVIGFITSASQKSLLAGVISALGLFYVHTQLPANPVFASSIGLGISAALLGVMGIRFVKSGKIFPPGVVSLASLIMTGGYIHGILRSKH